MSKTLAASRADLGIGAGRAAVLLLITAALVASIGIASAQVAGSTLVAVSVAELRIVAQGWSAKRQILGQVVYNDSNERVGSVDDIIVAGDKSVSYAIIDAGRFLGVNKYDIALPVSAFSLEGSKLILSGATRALLKRIPPFEYAS